jgi:hypothetical protein
VILLARVFSIQNMKGQRWPAQQLEKLEPGTCDAK